MNESPYFLTIAEIIRIHDAEIAAAGGSYDTMTKADLAAYFKTRSKEI